MEAPGGHYEFLAISLEPCDAELGVERAVPGIQHGDSAARDTALIVMAIVSNYRK